MDKKKILALMSGGVDSSTAAALLKQGGYDVAGVYLKFWDPAQNSAEQNFQSGEPCWAQEMRDVARVAAKLGIPFEVWDVTEDYKKRVLENFYAEYAAGRTPNPDVLCNSEIKFGVGLDRALKMGYEYVATGHYARVSSQASVHSSQFELYAALDKNKDQSYFLWRLTPEQLAHIMFPIGEYTKPQVRKLANKFGLHNAQKKDSQGVCFLGKIDLKEFLYRRNVAAGLSLPHGDLKVAATLTPQSGPIHDVHGNFLGLHDGLSHFTIGQRHGTKLGGTGPYFVVEKDMATNTLIVANTEDEPRYRAVRCQVSGVRFQVEIPVSGLKCMARTRYRAPLAKISYSHTREYESTGRVVFAEPARAVAPGQSIVFYEGDRVIGGGIIDSTILLCKVPKFVSVS